VETLPERGKPVSLAGDRLEPCLRKYFD